MGIETGSGPERRLGTTGNQGTWGQWVTDGQYRGVLVPEVERSRDEGTVPDGIEGELWTCTTDEEAVPTWVDCKSTTETQPGHEGDLYETGLLRDRGVPSPTPYTPNFPIHSVRVTECGH